MIKNARDCLFFAAMCLVTTSLSSMELSVGTPDQLRPPTSSVLILLKMLLAKTPLWTWTVEALYLEVTFHVSAAMAGIGVSLLAVLAKCKDDPHLLIPWLIFAINGILENQAMHLLYNTITVATATTVEPRVMVFHLITLLMLVEELRFWFAVFREYIVGAQWPFARWFSRAAIPGVPDVPATGVSEVPTSKKQEAGDYQADNGQTGGADVGEKTGPTAVKDQGDILETEVMHEQVDENKSDVSEKRDEEVDSAVEVEISNSGHD